MPVIQPAHFSELLLSLYASVDTPSQWAQFLSQLTALTGADGAALIQLDRQTHHPTARHIGYDGAPWKQFESYFTSINPGVSKLPTGARLPQGDIIDGNDVIPQSELRKTEFYNDWGRPNKVVHSIAANLHLSDQEFLYLCLNRGEKRGPHPAHVAQLLQTPRPPPPSRDTGQRRHSPALHCR